MKAVLFAAGMMLGLLYDPRISVTVYYPRTGFGQSLDDRRRFRIEIGRP